MQLFLFLGPEEFQKHEEMTRIVNKYFSKSEVKQQNENQSENKSGNEIGYKSIGSLREQPSVKIQSYHASSVDLEELHSLLLTPPLFGDIPPVLLSDIDLLASKGQKRLAELCAHCLKQNQGMFFLFSKEYKVSAPLTKIFPKREQRVFWDLDEGKKKGFIGSLLQKYGVKIELGAIELLLERVSNDLSSIVQTLETVLLYLEKPQGSDEHFSHPENAEGLFISEDLLNKIFTEHRSASVFDLFHHIIRRDLVRCLETAESLLLEGNNKAVALLSQLLYQWDKLLQVKERMAGMGDSFEDACSAEYIRTKALKGDMRLGVQNYQLAELRQIQKLNQDYNLNLKWSSGALQDLQFKHYLYEVLHIGC